MLYKEYINIIDEKADLIRSVSDGIWDHAETAFGEYESMDILSGALEKEGFTVTRGLCGIPTAFKAVYGSGHPAIGILAEYDALEGLNQQANVTEPLRIAGPDVGHGCGHNLFAGGSFAGALAVKAYVEKTGNGSITLFGCPAEENGSGKLYMAREGTFNDMDAIVSWHPEKMYMVRTRRSLAAYLVEFSFKGIPAHAGGSPHKGRSALDAVELMNVGCNYLREHMETTSRIHYAITDSGGSAPNVVQSHAQVRYMIRALNNNAVNDLKARVERVAQGAAMMTDTTVTSKVLSGYSSLITIPTLQQTAYEAMQEVPFPVPTEEDLAFGRALRATMNLTPEELAGPIYPESLLPPAPPKDHGGSTDTGDVSWNCPTVQMHIGNWCIGTPGHSWQAVAQGKSRYAHEAMFYAGKSLAGTAIRLMEDPERLKKAREEHAAQTVGGYKCPLPDDLKPVIQPRRK